LAISDSEPGSLISAQYGTIQYTKRKARGRRSGEIFGSGSAGAGRAPHATSP